MFYIKLLILKIKKMLRSLPGILAGALALCLIAGVFAYAGGKLIYGEQTVVKQRVGVVYPEDDKYIGIALGMVKNIDSVRSICTFENVADENTALEMLKAGELNAAVILPGRFIQDIVHGVNTPARIIMPKDSELYAEVFRSLADNGISMLADVQSAVQASFYASEGKDYKALEEKNDDFNMMYMDIFLPREKLFAYKSVSAAGDLSITEYYAVMAIVVFMLLCGMCLAFVTGTENKALYASARRRGIGRFALFAADNAAVLVFYLLLSAALAAALYAAGIDIRADFLALFIAVFLLSALVSGIYTVFSPWSGAMVLFVLTLVSAFVGGAVLPAAFLPEAIARYTPYSIVYVVFDALSNFVRDGFVFGSMPVWLVMLAVIYSAVFVVQSAREACEV